MASCVRVLALGFVLAAPGWLDDHQVSDRSPSSLSGRTSGLVNTCLITSHARQLADFYEPVLGLKAKWSGEDYAEFRTGVGVLAIFSFSFAIQTEILSIFIVRLKRSNSLQLAQSI
jgi:hypothetical protein